MKYSSRHQLPVVTTDGDGLVSHAGTLLLTELSDRVGLTDGLSSALQAARQRRSCHDPGVVLRDLAVMLADGGDCVSDLVALRNQGYLFGDVSSITTAWRVVGRATPYLPQLRAARASARTHIWANGGAPVGGLTLDFDATLVDAHSEKEGATGTWKHGFGFHPLMCYLDETDEPLAGMLRPGNAGSDTAIDHIAVLDQALAQIPASSRNERTILARADSGGASHPFADALRDRGIRFSLGYPLRPEVRAAIEATPDSAWVTALTQVSGEDEDAQVCELTTLDLSSWPEGTRAICRREHRHPGARQKTLPGLEDYRFVVAITDQPEDDIRLIEVCHRRRAHVEDGIRCGKNTGLRGFPSRSFKFNAAWLELIMCAQCLISWVRILCLTDGARWWEPKRLRYRLFHTAGRIVRTGRRIILRLQQSWPWADDLRGAFTRLRLMPAAP